MASDLQAFGRVFDKAGVRDIVIGGWAVIIRGAARMTLDVEVLYERGLGNIDRLVKALKPC